MFFHFINHLISNISVPIALTKKYQIQTDVCHKINPGRKSKYVIILAATHRAPCIALSFVLGTKKLPGTELMTLSCLLYFDPKL